MLYLDDNPVVAARSHCDRHVSKMLVEACIILSSVWHNSGAPLATLDWEPPTKDTPFRSLGWLHGRLGKQRMYPPSTHAQHPCIEWANLYGGNYAWLYQLAAALVDEFKLRKGGVHACGPVVRTLEKMPPHLQTTEHMYCDAPAIVPADCLSEDPVQSYRRYYQQVHMKYYTNRVPPAWLNGALQF